MKKGWLLECVNDSFNEIQIKNIPHRPQKGGVYELRKKLKTRNGEGLLLMEIENPLLEDAVTKMRFEPSFRSNRFKVVDDLSDNSMIEEIEEILEMEIY